MQAVPARFCNDPIYNTDIIVLFHMVPKAFLELLLTLIFVFQAIEYPHALKIPGITELKCYDSLMED